MPDKEQIRAKIEIIYGEGKPVVKLIGDVRTKDIRMSQIYIRRQFRAMISDNNRKIRKQELANKKDKENESRTTKEA